MINLIDLSNKIPSTLWKIGFIILLILVILFGIQTCNKTKEAHKLQNQLTTEVYNNKMAFDTVSAKDGSIKATQQQLKSFKDAAIIKQIELENKLKSVQSQVVVKTVYQIKEVFIPFLDTTKSVTKVDSSHGKLDTLDFIQVPARVQAIDPNFQLDATILKTGLEVNYLRIPNTTVTTIGVTKGLFKRQSVVLVKESNPNLTITDMKNIVDDPQVAKKQWTTFAIGGSIVVAVDAIIVAAYLLTH